MKRKLMPVVFWVLSPLFAEAQTKESSPAVDLTKQPTLYVVGYAHLDTQWRWDYPTTITQYLTKTMRQNFDLFERYPNYIFNFTGSNRYRMLKEYYPQEYERVKQYVAKGRWFPAGSSVEEGDVNAPSAEAILRQMLYGNLYFRREFGKASREYMLPDCFGFPASLPSIMAHAGVTGFSTQKLSPSWQPGARVGGPGSIEETPFGIPFNVGIWEGPDGRTVLSALNPGSYASSVTYDLSKAPEPVPGATPNARNPPIDWVKRVDLNGRVSGLFADYRYYGTGDTGGSPSEASVKLMESIVSKQGAGDGPLRVLSAEADQMFRDIRPDQTARLPRYKGDLELINHSAGSLTSQAYHKRWNRKNELLADAAEKASVTAEWLGGKPYPQQRLNDAWTLVMGGHFHDNMAGTSTPKAYEYTWNDDILAMNQFAGVLTSATETVASALDTQSRGVPIVVFNSLSVAREDVVEADIAWPGTAPKAVRVVGPDGKAVAAQVLSSGKILFVASVPSVGYAVYDVQAAPAGSAAQRTSLKATSSSLENARYRVTLNEAGDVASVFDKRLKRELLQAPMRLAIQTEDPRDWPAWNMDWEDQQKPPRAYVSGPARITVTENGPVRVALRIERETEGSKFVQIVRLAAGDAGNRVEVDNAIDWNTRNAALKATFPLAATNPLATYNWDIGTIERGNNDDKKFEVASHQWIDLTDRGGAFGTTVLTDDKIGSDKPDDNTLRLTLIYTPGLGEGNGRSYADQLTQDLGHHEFTYGLAGHAGDWRREQTDAQALRLNAGLTAFQTVSHRGTLGKTFSMLRVSNPRVRVMALKKAEESNDLILRLVEVDGKAQSGVRIALGSAVTAAREVNGQELPTASKRQDFQAKDGELVADFTAFEPRTFALTLAPAGVKVPAAKSQAVPLPHNVAVATRDGAKSSIGFDGAGGALPAELLPETIDYAGLQFKVGGGEGGTNAVVAKGQTVALPAGKHSRVYVLAASTGGDQQVTFKVGDKTIKTTVQDWGGYVGQWDNRQWRAVTVQVPPPATAPPGTPPTTRNNQYGEMVGITPGFIKPAPVAWFASHHHDAEGANVPYSFAYLFAHVFELTGTEKSLTLPVNDKVRVLAISVSDEGPRVQPVQPLLDVRRNP
jgi:alpha-mannosidase